LYLFLFINNVDLKITTEINENHSEFSDTNYPQSPKTEQFITAKIPANALKQRRRTYSMLRQRSSQLQEYKSARMSRRIAVHQKVCGGDGGLVELTV